jgi:flagellar hook protein FlgE
VEHDGMSLFGAMNTAISGLSAQSSSFGNISDNISNSQTVGYKAVDTDFVDYLTQSDATMNSPGSVVALPQYTNSVQGTLSQSTDPLAMAITGQGFFPVSMPSAAANTGQTSFSAVPYYTRAGDFSLNQAGYLVNSSGAYLNGWSIDPTTGVVNQNAISPIQVTQTTDSPVATTQVNLSANLPATPASATPVTSQINIYDSLGTAHEVDLDWTQTATDTWSVAINVPDNTSGAAVGTAQVMFGPTASGNAVPDGTVGSIGSGTGTVTTTAYASGNPADLTFTANFGNGAQAVTLNLGTYGQATGLTQYAGTSYSLRDLTQNGAPPGSFSSVSTNASGQVVVNYDNGQSRPIAQVPVVTFNDPDGLQRQDGQAFTATSASGAALANAAGSSGAGSIVTGSVEQSNVDISSELTKLIVAQQAYSANAKIITTANDMLQQTINLKQ